MGSFYIFTHQAPLLALRDHGLSGALQGLGAELLLPSSLAAEISAAHPDLLDKLKEIGFRAESATRALRTPESWPELTAPELEALAVQDQLGNGSAVLIVREHERLMYCLSFLAERAFMTERQVLEALKGRGSLDEAMLGKLIQNLADEGRIKAR